MLARASATISDVRSTLNASAETLGTADGRRPPVQHRASTSLRALDGALSLHDDLSSTLESTGSSPSPSCSRRSPTVDQMLGDTRAVTARRQVLGNGCTPGGQASLRRHRLRQPVPGRRPAEGLSPTPPSGARQPSADDRREHRPGRAHGGACRDKDSVTCSAFGAGSFAGSPQSSRADRDRGGAAAPRSSTEPTSLGGDRAGGRARPQLGGHRPDRRGRSGPVLLAGPGGRAGPGTSRGRTVYGLSTLAVAVEGIGGRADPPRAGPGASARCAAGERSAGCR